MTLLPLLNAEILDNNIEFYGSFKLNDCAILTQTCTNCTYVNITSIHYPNGTYALTDKTMTKRGTDYNYTFCNNTIIGDYIVKFVGDLNGITNNDDYYYTVTATGYEISTSQTIISIIGIFVILCFVVFLFVYGVIQENPTIKIFFLSLGLLFLIFSVGLILKIMQDSIGEFISFVNAYSSFYSMLTILLTSASVGLMLYIVAYTYTTFYKLRGYIDE